MRYIWQHIQTIISTYNGGIPLTHFLKNYYRLNPKLGSRDRKILSEMAYCWYRCSKGIADELPFEEKMQYCLQLCSSNQKFILPFLPVDEAPNPPFNLQDLFPYEIALSDGIERHDWLQSMLTQPDMFIRIRNNKEHILSLLQQQQIPFKTTDECTLALPNSTAIDKLLPEKNYVIQDVSSQATGKSFLPQKGESWYDCCAGAGGKSLLLKDLQPNVKLTVSDKRQSILHNLKERFKLYSHPLPVAHVLDAADKNQLHQSIGTQLFDGIICDVPCSGSGTWARTPEQLYFFEPQLVSQISALQRQIAVNVSDYIKPGGKLLYITCSVFREENEEVVKEILNKTNLQLAEQHLINGISRRADSMFIAVLHRPV